MPNNSSNSISWTDSVSAISSLIAAVFAVLTLFTFFVAAQEFLSRRHKNRLGLSPNSLGPWKDTVVSNTLFRLQKKISTPIISLPKLVANKWEPTFTFPTGFIINSSNKAATASPDIEKQQYRLLDNLAGASWVNFLQGLGITAESRKFYDMQSQPELVNGMVPMRWKGKDLVALSSILGFQCLTNSEDNLPCPRTPMPLPSQWSGPLGWLQFRDSNDGCVVEFLRRAPLANQLSTEIHKYYTNENLRPLHLVNRLWYSVSVFPLSEKEVLCLGGADKEQRGQDREDHQKRPTDKMFDELMESDKDATDIRKFIWGGKAKQPEALLPEACLSGQSQLSQASTKRNSTNMDRAGYKPKKVQVLKPCPGLFSVIVEREQIYSRGITYDTSHEYHREYTADDEVDKSTHPHSLGNLYMDLELLKLVKRALLKIQADGFYFTPSMPLNTTLHFIYEHIYEHSNRITHIFPQDQLNNWWKSPSFNSLGNSESLYQAMILCNKLQHIRKSSRASYTIEDMGVISKASRSLREILSPAQLDLEWAMISSPQLFTDLLHRFGIMDLTNVVTASIKIDSDGVIDCGPFTCPSADHLRGYYDVSCLAEGIFTGDIILVAFLDMLLNYFWIDKSWVSNVALYDSTIPQTVTMC